MPTTRLGTDTTTLRKGALGPGWGMPYSKLRGEEEGRIQSGLYIVQPAYAQWAGDRETTKGHRIDECFRCGAVGTKAYADEKGEGDALQGPSSLWGRMMMYDSNWLGGGQIYAFLDLDRPGQFKKSGNMRLEQKYKRRGASMTLVTAMEQMFHERLKRTKGIEVAKEKEWFHGNKEDMLAALLSLAGKENAKERLYLFDADGAHRMKVHRTKAYLQLFVQEREELEEVPMRQRSQRRTKANQGQPDVPRSQLGPAARYPQ